MKRKSGGGGVKLVTSRGLIGMGLWNSVFCITCRECVSIFLYVVVCMYADCCVGLVESCVVV